MGGQVEVVSVLVHASPRTPRALYFDYDVYVGYCHAGEVIELAVSDPKLGAVFYTLDQTNRETPVIKRQTHSCLQCHGATQSDGVPGFLVRSLFVAPNGLPILSEGSHRVDHTTRIKDRWGGWYVIGSHGSQKHLGNFVVRDRSFHLIQETGSASFWNSRTYRVQWARSRRSTKRAL